MKKIDVGQIITILANIGVIGGILLLAYELRQNNELMEAEARMNRALMATNAWRFTAEHGDVTELRERFNDGDELTSTELRRIEATVMSVFVLIEWTFRELSPDSSAMNQVREVQRYNFANHPEYPKVWDTRKTSFDPAFVQWMDENVIDPQ